MSPDGLPAMNWDCQLRGCFNRKKRLKFSAFKDCLPGKISFSDVDGLVEINGNLLLIEWKDHQSVSTGQRILFERLTRFCPAAVLIVEGDAETMAVESIAIANGGRIDPPEQADLDGLRKLIREWAQWALGSPVVRRGVLPAKLDDMPNCSMPCAENKG